MQLAVRTLRFLLYLTIFAGLLFLRVRLAPLSDGNAALFLITVGAASALYMIYFVVSEGHWQQIIGGLILSLIIDGLAAIFPPLIILVILWFLFNVAVAMQSILRLIPLAIASVCLYVMLFPDGLLGALGMRDLIGAPVLIAYVVFGVIYSARASGDPLKTGLFKFSTMVLSIPLIALLVASIQSGLRNLFETSLTRTSRAIKVPQNVNAHMRSGIEVSGYTRNISRTITETSVATRITGGGTGLAAGSATGEVTTREN